MSYEQFSGGPDGLLIELDTNTANICGNGNASYPSLYWQVPLSISFRGKQPRRFALRGANAQLFAGSRIAEARPIAVDRLIRNFEHQPLHEYLSLDFPLTSAQIRAFEDKRQGESLKLNLHMQLHLEEFVPVNVLDRNDGVCWQLENISTPRLQKTIEISQTHWIKQVLPNIGYGTIHVIEFPAVPVESCKAFDHSFKALKQAEQKHRLGFYDDAVGKCRTALEKFFEYVPFDSNQPDSRKIPVLKASWETKLGKATYDWLNQTLGAIKDASNRAHHSPNAQYSQLDSQMIIAITTAVVAFAARSSDAGEDH